MVSASAVGMPACICAVASGGRFCIPHRLRQATTAQSSDSPPPIQSSFFADIDRIVMTIRPQ